ncbi:SoxR reducing system RseC family protein [Allohahella marinimesophila]|uniref:RseC/MucC-like positive regulator of sigma(E) n=1 Tax=Allohahella marinimesophila TaxID=1054972 RepID=A0ABP7Q7L8_9GAMM
MTVSRQDCFPTATDSQTIQAMVRVLATTSGELEFEAIDGGAAGVCARCDQGKGCGQSLLLRLRRSSRSRLRLRLDQFINRDDWPAAPAPGALCRLEIPSHALLKMTVLLYGLPLFGLIVGTSLAVLGLSWLNPDASALRQDLLCAGAGIIGMVGGAGLVKNLSPLRYCEVRLHPQL